MQKYKARISLCFLKDDSGNFIKKTIIEWQKYAEQYARQKTKEEKYLWNSSIFLNDVPEIHCKIFDYVTISLFHSY